MGADKQAEPRRKSHVIRTTLICVGLVCLLIVGFVLFRILQKNRIKSHLDAIRASGYPVTMEELDAWYPEAPPERNAANVYRTLIPRGRNQGSAWALGAAFAKHDSRLIDWEDIRTYAGIREPEAPALSEPLSPDMTKGIANLFKSSTYAGELDTLHKAAALKESRYPIKLTSDHGMMRYHLVVLKFGTTHLQLEAFMLAEQGDSEKVVQSVISSLACGHSLKAEPVLSSQCTRMECDTTSCVTLERVLSRISFSDEQLARLAAALADEDDSAAITRAMVGERCAGLRFFERYKTFPIFDESNEGQTRRTGKFHLWSGRRDRDLIAYLDIMNRYIERSERPLPERFAGDDNAIEKDIADLPEYYVVTRLLAPVLARAFQRHGESIALLRCAMLAVTIERYRLAHTALPENLDALVPEFMEAVPLDPFDGKPLRFRKLEKGYVVYSVGMNQTDYGGILSDGEPDLKGSWDPLDIPFRVEK